MDFSRRFTSLLRPAAPFAALVLALTATACGDPREGAGEPDPPQILIFGTEHLAQRDTPRSDAEVAVVVDSLRPYAPDMVVVEYLPPEWPVGEGRDYRWRFDDSAYAADWGVPLDSAAERLAALHDQLGSVAYEQVTATDRCDLARLHFLTRDRANALYYWTDADCPAESDSLLTEWVAHRGAHEMAQVAFPIARERGLRGVVSFDYQGDDASWFLGPALFDEIRAEGTDQDVADLDSLLAEVDRFRAEADEMQTGSYARSVRNMNSARWIELQRRLYEDLMPTLTGADSAGARQTENYWLRNREMFDRIGEAVAARGADRILVVVGAGHKHFLDELAQQRGYRWVDPLEYLGR